MKDQIQKDPFADIEELMDELWNAYPKTFQMWEWN